MEETYEEINSDLYLMEETDQTAEIYYNEE